MPIKVQQINVNLLLDTYNLNKTKTGMNEMKMNDYEMSMRRSNRDRSIGYRRDQFKPSPSE